MATQPDDVPPFGHAPRFVGDARRNVVVGLGGIGTGHVGIAGDGTRRQWQLSNQGNHLGDAPGSFFALRACGIEPPFDEVTSLRGSRSPESAHPAPSVNDDVVPPSVDRTDALLPRIGGDEVAVAYPFVRMPFTTGWPGLHGTLTVHTPFVPLDAEASGLPVAVWDIELVNDSAHLIHGWVVATTLNSIGWDGIRPFDGVYSNQLGGNVNTVDRDGDTTRVTMTVPDGDRCAPSAGELLLQTDAPCSILLDAGSEAEVTRWLGSLKLLRPTVTGDWSEAALRLATAASGQVPHQLTTDGWAETKPSEPGGSWMCALAAAFAVAEGTTQRLRFVEAWRFANRIADFDQFGSTERSHRPPLGNHYAQRYATAASAADEIGAHPEWERSSARWARDVLDNDLPVELAHTVNAMPAYTRSPSVFRDAAGRWLGFEGTLGRSTRNWNGDVGGSCPLNCTHVWNYDQTLARLFPDADRSMRELEWDVMLAPAGYLPHRLLVPIEGPQFRDEKIGGPDEPALDGMLGAILKTYRYVRASGDLEWLAQRWPAALRLLDYVRRTWDPSGDGVLTGAQPVTHDIALTGPNMFVGGLWLAALRAVEEMHRRLGDEEAANARHAEFEHSSAEHVRQLWNGEYFGQTGSGHDFDFGDGCLSDQLFGQWWAHQLDLGHLVPAELVRTALLSVTEHNLQHGFRNFQHGYRVFADEDDTGLLVCTWPRGGRPATPIRYADEVWTGVEYQVAAHCLIEGRLQSTATAGRTELAPTVSASLDGGLADVSPKVDSLTEAGLRIVRAVRQRYDGRRRNPFNEVECGDHYVRAMAGWSLLPAWTGLDLDRTTGILTLARTGRFPFLFGSAWGKATVRTDGVDLEVHHGELEVTAVCRPGFDTTGHDRVHRLPRPHHAGTDETLAIGWA